MKFYYSILHNFAIDAKVFVIAKSTIEAKELMLAEIEAQGYNATAADIELIEHDLRQSPLFLHNT